MLGPKRDMTGRGLPVPRRVTLMVCAEPAGANHASAGTASVSANKRLRGNMRSRPVMLRNWLGLHRFDDGVSKFGGSSLAADITS
jgi:hypothetical protein